VLMEAPIPPPCGGISTWTEGLLSVSSMDQDVQIVHVDSAVRFRSIGNMNLAVRFFGGTIHGVALFFKFAAKLIFQRIDVAHICMGGSLGTCRDFVLVAFARMLRVPTVVHLRFGRLPAKVALMNWEAVLIGWICRLSKCAIVLDPASEKAVRALAPECSVFEVPNPAWKINEIAPETKILHKVRTVLFVGHVIPTKGVSELIMACREIVDSDFKLDVIGPVENEYRQELLNLAIMKDNGKWINIQGHVNGSEIPFRMAQAQMVVLPSYTEGFPNVILEAMCLSKPVIATPVGAISKILDFDGINPCGIEVPVQDVNALKNAIETLLWRPDYALQLGINGRKRVESEYSPDAIYEKYKIIWERIGGKTESISN